MDVDDNMDSRDKRMNDNVGELSLAHKFSAVEKDVGINANRKKQLNLSEAPAVDKHPNDEMALVRNNEVRTSKPVGMPSSIMCSSKIFVSSLVSLLKMLETLE